MNGMRMFLLGLALALAAIPSHAEQLWLLLHESSGRALIYADGNGTERIADIGFSATYGESGQTIVVVSQQPDASFRLDVIDKSARRRTASWPLKGHAKSVLSGPSRDVVVANGAAYFITIRYRDVRTSQAITKNELGGEFDLTWVSLQDGSHSRAPLPPECINARLAWANDSAWIYTFGGPYLWKVDLSKGRLQQLISRNDLDDTLASVDAEPTVDPGKPGLFADFVLLPSGEILRLSKFGKLQHVLDADLRRPNAAPIPADVVGTMQLQATYALTLRGEPVVGLVGTEERGMQLRYVDPQSLQTLRNIALPAGAVPESLLGVGDAVYFVDRSSKEVLKLSNPQADPRIEPILNLEQSIPGSRLDDPRIVAVNAGR